MAEKEGKSHRAARKPRTEEQKRRRAKRDRAARAAKEKAEDLQRKYRESIGNGLIELIEAVMIRNCVIKEGKGAV